MRRRAVALAAAAVLAAVTAPAQSSWRPSLQWSLELKGAYRESDDNVLVSPRFFPPDRLPPGQTETLLRTVDPGSHAEFVAAILQLDAAWGSRAALRLKVDAVDLYDRNPTSEDREVDLDEAWVRFGAETAPGRLAAGWGAYLKAGKIAKFERQDDRHLESYGLAATAFNRFEDAGVEAGVDLGRHVYLKASWTTGNPVFLRDPNALAGDNGTPERLRSRPDNAPELNSGVVILYDAEIEDWDLGEFAELGAGLGVRFGNEAGTRAADVLVWRFERTLAPTVDLEGTFYGGDLDLLDGPPAPGSSLPIRGDEKVETGANLWLYLGGFSFFGQYVDQEMAGLPRTGYDAEAAWRLDLPLLWAAGGEQLFPSLQPVVRYSKLDPDIIGGGPMFPAVSVRWEWEKVDLGLRATIVRGLDVTVEAARHDFVLASGAHRENDEYLMTVRWRWGR
jgi:hypothetical protein